MKRRLVSLARWRAAQHYGDQNAQHKQTPRPNAQRQQAPHPNAQRQQATR